MDNYKIILLVITLVLFAPLVVSIDKLQAQIQINESLHLIEDMEKTGFGIILVTDLLVLAKETIKKTDYALIIKNNVSGDKYNEAVNEMDGYDIQDYNYDKVLDYTSQIALTYDLAYEVKDMIRASELTIQNSPGLNLSTASKLLNDANIALDLERYGEAKSLVEDSNNFVDKVKLDQTALNLMVKSSKSMLEKSWPTILIIIIMLFFIVIITYILLKRRKKINSIIEMRLNKKLLNKLIKNTQEDRYKKNKISKTEYEVKLKVYKKKLADININLPTLEKDLK